LKICHLATLDAATANKLSSPRFQSLRALKTRLAACAKKIRLIQAKKHCCQTVAKGTVDKQLQKHCCQTVSQKHCALNCWKKHCCQTVAKGTVAKQLQKALLPNSFAKNTWAKVLKS
jgi:hypothetical protein